MKLFAKETVNTGRQFEMDMAKFVCLMGMAIVHVFEVTLDFSVLDQGIPTFSVQYSTASLAPALS